MNKIELIKSGQIEDLKAQTFGQKLESYSEGTYTAVLSEEEELAVVQQVVEDNEQSELWRVFFEQYISHYVPFNSALKVLIENLYVQPACMLLLVVAKRWGLAPDIMTLLCQKAIKEELAETAPILAEYAQNPRSTRFYEDTFRVLERFDDRLDGKASVKCASLYRKFFKQ
ncbi:MAG: hypothetical protein J6N45_07190 [Alphaproteobacteria bacterium]|nr:hypothetical protein [Alphaproteobacteria bacterium]